MSFTLMFAYERFFFFLNVLIKYEFVRKSTVILNIISKLSHGTVCFIKVSRF